MTERKIWLNNPVNDRLAMLQQTETGHHNININAIEKDWWVTICLKALFMSDCADYLLFKGGTSLSKGWSLIERFSEDIDLAISHTYFGINSTTKSQREKLRKASRKYILEELALQLDSNLRQLGVSGYTIEKVTHIEGIDGERRAIDSDKDPAVLLVNYSSILPTTIVYLPQRVKIEISCLSMDEPSEERNIKSLIAESFPEEDTIDCKIRTVLPTRTFLEKIFLLAEDLQKDKPRTMRMSRHLYDLNALMNSRFAESALADRELIEKIIEHRRHYYVLKYVDYDTLYPGRIEFLPQGENLKNWENDYQNMKDYFIYGNKPEFSTILENLNKLQDKLRNL
ncbi:MAG: nucleotidyl transferase AbiEii/AbiGii toxin family protein [Paludibacteraceae bacterium]|nr:nucleotidyl transferase AbiEii/AbiGii toxin family protein [Paludibacteraceae bacterium]